MIDLLAALLLVASVAGLWLLLATRVRPALRAPPGRTGAMIVVLAAAVGMIAGLVEAVVTATRAHLVFRHGFSWDVIWMAPLVGMLVFAAAAALVVTLGRAWREPISLPPVLGALGLVAAYNVVRSLEIGIGPVAALALALGVAVQVGRIGRDRPIDAERALRRGGMLAAAVVIVGMTLSLLLPVARERLAIMRLPASKTGVPNVLLIILDTVRAQSLGLYGHAHPTSPELERFARRATVFDRAISPSSWTLPAHASMFTGRSHSDLSVDFDRPLDTRYTTIAEHLGRNGYRTAGIVANWGYGAPAYGLDRGFQHYRALVRRLTVATRSFRITRLASQLRNRLQNLHHDQLRWHGERVTDAALAWIRDHRRSSVRPFFVFVNYLDAHDPFEAGGEARAHRHERRYWHPSGPEPMVTTDLAQVEASYDRALAYLDRTVGHLLDELDGDGVLDSTVVIITSDHGEHLGEQGIVGHGKSLYPLEIHVPLLIAHRGLVPVGSRVSTPVSTRAVAATIARLTGSDAAIFQAPSLSRFWEADTASALPVVSELTRNEHFAFDSEPARHGRLRSVFFEGVQYIRREDGGEEITDWERATSGPGSGSAPTPLLERLRALLDDRPPGPGWLPPDRR